MVGGAGKAGAGAEAVRRDCPRLARALSGRGKLPCGTGSMRQKQKRNGRLPVLLSFVCEWLWRAMGCRVPRAGPRPLLPCARSRPRLRLWHKLAVRQVQAAKLP